MTRQRGFTLVELIVVMVIIGAIAGVLVLQLRPAMQSYLAIRQRANLTSQADAALRRIINEVHTAVPNSLRYTWESQQSQCIEFVPTKDGGRFRTAQDYTNVNQPQGAALVPGVPVTTFDTLTDVDTASVVHDDRVVVGNVNRDDVYAGTNVGTIDTVAGPTPNVARNTITLKAAITFPAGYEGGRFLVIPQAERAVTYTCTMPTSGATGTIVRVTGYAPSAAPPKTCPTGPAILVAKVSDCSFLYHESQGATQQSGYLQLRLGLTDGDESVKLTMGAHVENVP
jgi:MSHA biogenesis protein MshO